SREGERPAFQPAGGEGEPVPLPGQDLQPVPALVAEHVQGARERGSTQVRGHHRPEAGEALATILRGGAGPNSAGETEGQHGSPPSAATRRATAAGSAPAGTRTTTPVGSTTSTGMLGTTRTAAKLGGGGAEAIGALPRAMSRFRQA